MIFSSMPAPLIMAVMAEETKGGNKTMDTHAIKKGDWINVDNEWYQVRAAYVNGIDIDDERVEYDKRVGNHINRCVLDQRKVKGVISDEAMAQRLDSVLASATTDSAVARVVRNSKFSS